jgi:hypothetical protein
LSKSNYLLIAKKMIARDFFTAETQRTLRKRREKASLFSSLRRLCGLRASAVKCAFITD